MRRRQPTNAFAVGKAARCEGACRPWNRKPRGRVPPEGREEAVCNSQFFIHVTVLGEAEASHWAYEEQAIDTTPESWRVSEEVVL